MSKGEFTQKEKLMLYGLTRYPNQTDKDLSEKLKLKHSTVTSIRHRLRENDYFRKLNLPNLQKMGCEMLVVIYTSFSPLIPLGERIEITGETIEVFDEIFFSVGEQEKGFSLSLSKDYATIGRINDIRTQTFGGRGLLEEEYPNMIVFPFAISRVYRFFDFAPLLNQTFNLNFEMQDEEAVFKLKTEEKIEFSDTEKNVFCMLVSYPEMSDGNIGDALGVSRHTVSRLRKQFEEKNLVQPMMVPDLNQLGFDILTFYHIQFDPRNPPDMDDDEARSLLTDSTIFLASRTFEAVMVSAYSDYDGYKADRTKIMQVLKENKWIAKDPVIRTYGLNKMVFIKDFKFAPITHKIVGCDFWVKKLLNI